MKKGLILILALGLLIGLFAYSVSAIIPLSSSTINKNAINTSQIKEIPIKIFHLNAKGNFVNGEKRTIKFYVLVTSNEAYINSNCILGFGNLVGLNATSSKINSIRLKTGSLYNANINLNLSLPSLNDPLSFTLTDEYARALFGTGMSFRMGDNPNNLREFSISTSMESQQISIDIYRYPQKNMIQQKIGS